MDLKMNIVTLYRVIIYHLIIYIIYRSPTLTVVIRGVPGEAPVTKAQKAAQCILTVRMRGVTVPYIITFVFIYKT